MESYFTYFSSLVAGILAVFVIKWLWSYQSLRSTFNKIAGPEDVFLLGNSLLMKKEQHLNFKLIMELLQKYNGLIRIWRGPSPIVLIGKPQAAEFLIGSTKNLSKGYAYRVLYPWLGFGLLTSSGEKWKARRKLLTPAFHFKILNNFLHLFQEQSEVLVAELKAKCGDEPFDIFPFIGRCALDIICETAMGKSVSAQENTDSEYVTAVLKISTLLTVRGRSPWLWCDLLYSLTSSGRTHSKCLKILHSFTNKVIDEKIQEKRASAKENRDDRIKKKKMAFLDLLLECFEEGAIDREGLREEVDTFMFEGHDTTTAGISWALYLLGLHPEIQEKVYDEVEQFCACPRDGLTTDSLKELKLLECVIKESLRLFPPVAAFSRTLDEDSIVCGNFIPKGCTVIVSVAGIHRNSEVWPDPLKFDPDRFLPENFDNRNPYAFLPFSAGPRNCIGQRFALMEEKMVLLNIIRHFRVQSVQPFDEVNPCPELILRPKDGIIVKLISRT